MNRLALLAAATALALPCAQAAFSFNIVEDSSFTAAERAGISYAKNFWESRIGGYDASINTTGLTHPTGLTIYASSAAYAAGVTGYVYDLMVPVGGGLTVADTAVLEIDSGSVDGMIAAGTFNNAMVRAFGHALGFGNYNSGLDQGIWNRNGLTGSSTTYTGAYALAAYNAEFGATATSITLAGTDPKGWSNANLSNDLLAASPTNLALATLSATSLAAFRDLGYTVVPEPSAYGLAAAGALGALALVRRRKRR